MMDDVLPGRDCGTCHACCISLTIDDPELSKVQGYRCKNLSESKGCTIYETRPETCRSFNCGWRVLKWVKLALRPDVSGVLVRFERNKDDVPGVSFMLLTRVAARAEGLAESVAAAIAAGVPVSLSIPGPPGFTAAHAPINEVLAHAVATKDKKAVQDFLVDAARQGRKGNFVPIRIPRAQRAKEAS